MQLFYVHCVELKMHFAFKILCRYGHTQNLQILKYIFAWKVINMSYRYSLSNHSILNPKVHHHQYLVGLVI